jgi:hypothetical protein
LYSGPAALRGILSDEVMNHFMLLSVDISLLAHPEYYLTCNDYAHKLLKMFVKQSANTYGVDFVVYNVHGLLHLAADAKLHGCLDTFSAFPYENELKLIKRLVRKAEVPLSQVVRQLRECRVVYPSSANGSDSLFHLSVEHHSGLLVPGLDWIHQYKKLKL